MGTRITQSPPIADQDGPKRTGYSIRNAPSVIGAIGSDGWRVRVTVQLVRTSDGKPIWATSFDERMEDVFGIQDAIAERVVSALQVPLSRDGWGQLSMHETNNMVAYRAFLDGAVHLTSFAPAGSRRASSM